MHKIRFRNLSKYYWLCQIGGWGSFFVILSTLQLLIKVDLFEYSVLTCLSGLLTTHLLRTAIRRFGWLNLPPKKSLVRLLLAVVLASTLAELIRRLGIDGLNRVTVLPAFLLRRRSIFLPIIEYGIPITSWALIYCFYNYIGKARKESLEKWRLEQKIQEMEQQAGESAVDVDFLINSLQQIRSSIEENPARSRAEITEFSNLLRRGFLTPE